MAKKPFIGLIMSDMNLLTIRDLNGKTSMPSSAGKVLNCSRNGRAIGYITRTQPGPERRPDWKHHFNWLRKQATQTDVATLTEFEQERRRQAVVSENWRT